jgi:hypothetical protein
VSLLIDYAGLVGFGPVADIETVEWRHPDRVGAPRANPHPR